MENNGKLYTLREMLTKKVSGYRKVPMLEMGSPIRILLSTPDDSDCEVDDAFETISDITPEINSNKLSVEGILGEILDFEIKWSWRKPP
ncbi:hypothetical protein CEXT_239561 [Caerostris extrusa]|uniref:Uncharacterized protein n=1 Tax=Caerostris extrusa TaxID=172846 RepID=A0AAV4UMS4_CAEEX|nr:hypothetical protein CEXT_239561 [Caerostris extrusa]